MSNYWTDSNEKLFSSANTRSKLTSKAGKMMTTQSKTNSNSKYRPDLQYVTLHYRALHYTSLHCTGPFYTSLPNITNIHIAVHTNVSMNLKVYSKNSRSKRWEIVGAVKEALSSRKLRKNRGLQDVQFIGIPRRFDIQTRRKGQWRVNSALCWPSFVCLFKPWNKRKFHRRLSCNNSYPFPNLPAAMEIEPW
jgi:hypothetical protein